MIDVQKIVSPEAKKVEPEKVPAMPNPPPPPPLAMLKPEEVAQLVTKRTALAKIKTLRGMKVPDARIADSTWADAGLKRGDPLP